jgi:hypothetical protein
MNELKRNESMTQTTRQLHFSFSFPLFFVFCTVPRVSLFCFFSFFHSFISISSSFSVNTRKQKKLKLIFFLCNEKTESL